MTKITIYNVQRAVTAKVGKEGLWFLCFTCHLMVLNTSFHGRNISENFPKNISNIFQVTGLT